jgi:thiazole synthase ThiGH ThiG subunit
MFWSHETTWISLHVGAKQLQTLLPVGYARVPTARMSVLDGYYLLPAVRADLLAKRDRAA